jgi:hypothetical protein
LHELAHDVVESNDHLHHDFYDTVNEVGAKLAVLIQNEPTLFEDNPSFDELDERIIGPNHLQATVN